MSKYTLFENKVFLVLTDSNGKLLLLQNNHENSIIKGYLNPPAGHLEINESIIDTAKREALEELGINDLSEIELKGTVNVFGFKDNPVYMLVVSAIIPDAQIPTDNGEGMPVWVTLEKLAEHKVLEDVEQLIRLSQETPKGKLFHCVSKFENRKLVSFEVQRPE